MSRAEDDLLNIYKEPEEETAADKEARLKAQEAIKEDARKRLKVLQQLQSFAPFQVFLQELRKEEEVAFNDMERTSDPTSLAKSVGAFCAIYRTARYCETESRDLLTFLKTERLLD